MLILSRRAWIWSAAGTLLLTAPFAVFLAVRSGPGLDALRDAWDNLLLVAGLVWLALLLAAWAARRRYRRALAEIGDQLAAFRKHPAAHPLATPELLRLLGPFADQLEALCTSHHKALADLIQQRDSLESLRGQVNRAEGDKSRTIIQRGSGSSRNMVARLTPNLFWITATPALKHFLGHSLADLNGRPFAELVPAEDFAPLPQVFREALETGEAHNITFRVLCRALPANAETATGIPQETTPSEEVSPRVRHVQMDVLTRYGDDGTPLHFRCFFVDITDRVRAERELRRRSDELARTNEQLVRINQDLKRLQQSYFDLYHHAPVMYFSLDDAGRLVTFNETLCQILGYAREELHQQLYTRLLPPESREHYLKDTGAYQQQGEVETRWLKHDGTVIDVWIRSVPVQDEQGHFVRSRSVAQDVTERNRLADELRRRRDELERANVDLRRINKELDDFTSVISHDLRAGLLTIDATSNSLAEEFSGKLGADGFEYVTHLRRASRRLRRMIEELRTLSRAGRITTAPRPFDLMQVVAAVRTLLGTTISDKRATVLTEGSLPAIRGDSERVTQLLANLVANGLKYNQNPTPRIVIGELRQGDQQNGANGGAVGPEFAILYVRDNGIGIDPAHHKQIFDPFRRLHREGEYEGTGAGLTICKRIVEAHEGRIWVESEPDKGATFYFTLPRALRGTRGAGSKREAENGKRVERRQHERQAPPQPPPVAPRPSPLAPRPSENGPRLLLVEDMDEVGRIVQRLAKHAGHSLEWVTRAEEAWAYLQEHRPELVLLDIHLPGMDGIELCRKLRAAPEHAGLPIALFSGGAEAEDIKTGLEAGANFVLAKELLCQPDAWRRRLEEILQQLKRITGDG